MTKMTSEPDPIVARMKLEMERSGATQAGVANACHCSQSYINKILKSNANVSPKMRLKLEAWLARSELATSADEERMEALIRKLLTAKEPRRGHIVHILRELSEISR